MSTLNAQSVSSKQMGNSWETADQRSFEQIDSELCLRWYWRNETDAFRWIYAMRDDAECWKLQNAKLSYTKTQ
jgi:hypothetical protein